MALVAFRLEPSRDRLALTIAGDTDPTRGAQLERWLDAIGVRAAGAWRVPIDHGRAVQAALRAAGWRYEVSVLAEAAMSTEADA